MNNPERTTAAAFSSYLAGEVLAESSSLNWSGLYVRRYRFPCAVEQFQVPATPEPLISCGLSGSAEFHERDAGDSTWISRPIGPGDIFITHSRTPYEVTFHSPGGQELEVVQIHIAVDLLRSALETAWPDTNDSVEVMDFFGRDESLAHLCRACAAMVTEGTPGTTHRVEWLSGLLAAVLAEKYTRPVGHRLEKHGGLPVYQLRKVENHVRLQPGADITVQSLADLVGLSKFHFSRSFRETTGMTPLEFLTRERMKRAGILLWESSRSIIDIAMDVGYSSPNHFSRVFRRITGSSPSEFRSGR
jgi:AraC family transcriptional regulator